VTTRSPGRPRDGRAIVVYTALRAALLAVCVAVGWVAGLNGPLLFVLALLVSGAFSWFLLQGQRTAVGVAVQRRLAVSRQRMAARTAAEDAYVDALHQRADETSLR
jgi:hypothetical protein